MARRVLVVAETDPGNADHGKLFGLDPSDAAGIGLPAFRAVASLPAAGTVEGEAVYDRSHRQGFVWTKNSWQGLAPNPIKTYATEAALLADTGSSVGTYATAGDTGNLFIARTAGWGQVGIHEYKTVALLLAATPLVGALGEALDEGSLWEMTAKGWRSLVTRELVDTTAVLAWANPANATGSAGCNIGDQAIDATHDVTYVRTAGGWRPTSIWEAKESEIRAATWCVNGQEAIAKENGKLFTWLHHHWLQAPIEHFAKNSDLLAATPPDGVLAWADDLHNVYARTNGQWQALNTGFYDPTPIGTIAAFATHTMPAGWLHCDGAEIPAGVDYDELRKLLGTTTTPNLRGQFLRGAATLTDALLAKTAWTTGMPKTAFTTSTDGLHHHSTQHQGSGMNGGPWETLIAYNNVPHTYQTTDNGAHSHTITGGGDVETAPDHVKIHWGIKAKFATVLPANQLLVNVGPAAAAGDVLAFDAAAGAWRNRATTHFGTTAPKSPLLGWVWYNTTTKVLTIYDGSAWIGTRAQAAEFYEAEVTLGANANTVNNEIILVKGIKSTNDGLYISVVDGSGGTTERASYALHAFATDYTAAGPCVPIHLQLEGGRFEYLRFYWKDSTDNYCLSAKISTANSAGTIYRVGLMSPTGGMTGIQVDGNTLDTPTRGTTIKCKTQRRRSPLYQFRRDVSVSDALHQFILEEPAENYAELNGFVQALPSYTAQPWFRFGTTVVNLSLVTNVFHAAALTAYKSDGWQDYEPTYLTVQKCGLVFSGVGNVDVRGGSTLVVKIRVTKKSDSYWEVWQESFYRSTNDTPMRMDAKYEINTTGLGNLTGIGCGTYDFAGTTLVNSVYGLNVESM